MKYDVESSFAIVKNDTNWVKKLLIGSGLIIAAVVLFFFPTILAIVTKTFNAYIILAIIFCWISALLLGFSVSGYCLQAAQDRIHNRVASLPEWDDFWSYVFIGFKCALGSTLYYLPVIVLGIVAGIYEVIAKQQGTSSGSANSYETLSFFFNLVHNLIYLVFLFFYFVFNANFIKDFNVFSFVNVREAYKLLKSGFVNYVILVALVLALGVLFNFAAIILCITIVGIILLPFLSVYIQLVTMDITAQYISIADSDACVADKDTESGNANS